MENIIIPEISDKELKERYKRMKPIVRLTKADLEHEAEHQNKKYMDFVNYNEGMLHHLFKSVAYKLKRFDLRGLRNTSYIFDAVNNRREAINPANHMELICDYTCYHKSNNLFIPTIAEVLSQMPEIALEQANAFFMTGNKFNGNQYTSNIQVLNIEF